MTTPKNNSDSGRPAQTGSGDEKRSSATLGKTLWLLLGLAPVPILMLYFSVKTGHQWDPFILVLCALGSFSGAMGSVRGVRNAGTRAILGLFLAGFLILLSWAAAAPLGCGVIR